MDSFNSCVNCGSIDNLFVELYEGYLICDDCSNDLFEDLEIPYAPI